MVTHNRRAVLKAAGSFVVIGSLAGCTGGEGETSDDEADDSEDDANGSDTDEEMAMVRAAHLSPDAPAVDVYVDDEPAAEDVSFGDVSEYLELEPGSYDVRITEAGTDATVYEDSVDVENAAYTFAAIGELGEDNQPLAVEVFEDDLSDPGDNARIRGVHAAPDAPAVDVVDEESGDPLFEELEFGEAQSAEAPPGDYTLEVLPAGDEDADPVETFDVTVEEGVVYSAFAVGYLEPDDAPVDEPFDLLLVEDSTGTEDESEESEESE